MTEPITKSESERTIFKYEKQDTLTNKCKNCHVMRCPSLDPDLNSTSFQSTFAEQLCSAHGG